jgi:hypothetical protein
MQLCLQRLAYILRHPRLQVFDQALEGGGAKNINFQELAADLAQVGRQGRAAAPAALGMHSTGCVWAPAVCGRWVHLVRS